MGQEIISEFKVDGEGNPSGGHSRGEGIDIRWQDGLPLDPASRSTVPTGALVDGVITAAVQRLEFYQEVAGGRFKCMENERAISDLRAALRWLDIRRLNRHRKGVR